MAKGLELQLVNSVSLFWQILNFYVRSAYADRRRKARLMWLLRFLAVAGSFGFARWLWKSYKVSCRLSASRAKKDVVIFHQFPRACSIPSISPFCLKLETYLRMAGLPYKNDFKDFMGPKGKCPYITLNGEDIADSQIIIDHLNIRYDVDLNEGLSVNDKAVALAFRCMAEEHFFWAISLSYWVYDKQKNIKRMMKWPFPYSHIIYPFLQHATKSKAWAHGIGRHSWTEIVQMAARDLRAMSTFLGDKPFFMGDNPTEVDCVIFGFIAPCVWNWPGSKFEEMVNDELLNLKDYAYRMKERFWPDWDECLSPARTLTPPRY